jgi:hypothetical protein
VTEVSPLDPTPIEDPWWIPPLWRTARPFALSRVTAALTPGLVPLPYDQEFRVQVVIAPDPEQHMDAGYFPIAELKLNAVGKRSAIVDIPWPFGVRMIPAGWWVCFTHDKKGVIQDVSTEYPVAKLSGRLYGCDL